MNWLRRRWFEFRQGHSIYLAFFMSFTNFILISYRLLIERVEVLNQIFSDLSIFILVFILAYIPIAILIGRWHRKTQLRVESTLSIQASPLYAKMIRLLLEAQQGKANKKEIEDMIHELKKIEDNRL